MECSIRVSLNPLTAQYANISFLRQLFYLAAIERKMNLSAY